MDLFTAINTEKLKGLRICLAGTFSVPTNVLKKQLINLGANVDVVSPEPQSDTNSQPKKESTNLFVIGKDVPSNSLIRYALNCHDGYHALKITEDELNAYLQGNLELEIPRSIIKHIDIDYSYYEWTAPGDKVTYKSSPIRYDLHNIHSPVYGHEIFIPEMDGVDIVVLGQIIGLLGGFSNNQCLPNTDIVLLSDSMVENLRNGIKDAAILKIENNYNKGNAKNFSCTFTCLSDFMNWVYYRLSQCPDLATQALVDRLYI